MPLSSHQRAQLSAALARYIADLEDAQDLQALEIHFHRAGAYIAAIRDLEVSSTGQTDGLLLVIDMIYRQGLARLAGTLTGDSFFKAASDPSLIFKNLDPNDHKR